ncbi:hypothetical protein Aduo_014719 [Ancylostoma duodenale]
MPPVARESEPEIEFAGLRIFDGHVAHEAAGKKLELLDSPTFPQGSAAAGFVADGTPSIVSNPLLASRYVYQSMSCLSVETACHCSLNPTRAVARLCFASGV